MRDDETARGAIKAAREQREARALRANLSRRKQQARAREAMPGPESAAETADPLDEAGSPTS